MQRVDTFGNTGSLPAAEAQVNSPGYFTIGNPTLSVPATIVPAWWLNSIQEEILAVLAAAGVTPDKAINTQLRDSILGIAQNYQETTFSIANNQSSFANVTGMVLNKTLYTSAVIQFDAYRKDGAQERRVRGRMYAIYKPILDIWELHGIETFGADDFATEVGMEFEIVAASGQVRYKSSNFGGGSYAGSLRFKFDRFGV